MKKLSLMLIVILVGCYAEPDESAQSNDRGKPLRLSEPLSSQPAKNSTPVKDGHAPAQGEHFRL